MFLKGLLAVVAVYDNACPNEGTGKTKKWRQWYLYEWEYGKYVTRILDVVANEIYE